MNIVSGSGSRSKQPEYDTNRFPSQGSYEHFMCVIATRNLIPERALSLEVNFFPHIIVEIQRRGWEALAKQPKDAIAPLVTKFYSGIEEGRDVSIVRGVRVPFFPSRINGIYHVADIADDDFLRFLSQPFDEVHIAEVLCGPRINWIHTKNVAVRFRGTNLTVSN